MFRERMFASMAHSVVAAVRSQGGSGTGLVLSCSPTCRTTKLEAQLFRVTLLRRLQLPLPFTERSCRCGLPLDSLGHHRAPCARAGVLGKRRWALQSVAARICREGGGRVTTNVLERDLDLVVVDGFSLFGGVQLVVDTTFVCALRSDDDPPHGLLLKMEPRSPERGGARRPHTQSWVADTPGRVWCGSGWPVRPVVRTQS